MACERDFGFCGVLTLRKKTTAQKRHEMCEKKKKKKKNRTKNLFFFVSLVWVLVCDVRERESIQHKE